MTDLDASLDFILRWEGPEINESAGEPGGISKYGCSLQTYREDGHPDATKETIRSLTEDQARAFYSDIAGKLRFAELPPGVDLASLDLGVTVGSTGAALILQMTVDMWPTTGKIDDQTMALLKAADPKMIVTAAGTAWLAWKARSDSTLAAWAKFQHGWIRRDADFRSTALKMGVN